MDSQRVQTSVDDRTVDALEAYAADREIDRSEAIAQATKVGLAAKGYEVDPQSERGTIKYHLETIERQQRTAAVSEHLTLFGGFGFLIVSVAFGLSGPWWGVVGLLGLAAIGATSWLYSAAFAQRRWNR